MDRINLGSISQILFAFPVYSCLHMVLGGVISLFEPVDFVV